MKFLSRNKLYTFINVLGLSVSLTFVILITNYAFPQFRVDRFHENADQIYTIGEDLDFGTSYIYAARLKDNFPDIKQTCALTFTKNVGTIKVSDVEYEDISAYSVDTSFFDMFSFELKYGARTNALADLNNVVISEAFAKKTFGESNPLGEMIILQDSVALNVSGVVKDFENTQFHDADMIVRIEHAPRFNRYSLIPNNASGVVLFIQGFPGADLTLKRDEILEYFQKDFWIYENGTFDNVTITPLKEMYLSEGSYDYGTLALGDKTRILMLSIVGLIILVFAIFNYINLTVAQTGFRAKEVATRRLLGASKHSVFSRMILESTLLCGIAFLFALVLAVGIEDRFNSLIYADISILDNLSIGWVSSYIVLIFALGVVSGIVPAVVISRFLPIDVVKGTFAFKSKMVFSKIFITVQNVITIALIICSITTVKQVLHTLNADLGYNQKHIINVHAHKLENRNHIKLFYERLNSLSFVKRIGLTSSVPLYMTGGHGIFSIEGMGDEMISLQKQAMDTSALNMLGIEILRDHKLAENGFWLTESGIKQVGKTQEAQSFKSPSHNYDYKIKGVLKDFVMGSIISKATRPLLMLEIFPDFGEKMSRANFVLVEVQGGLTNSYQEIEKAFTEVTEGAEFEAYYIDDEIENMHQELKNLYKVIIIFAVIAIIISMLGLLAMSVYFIQQKSKEIALRKVFGSTSLLVLRQLIWQFLRLVVIAFIIACPIIGYLMSKVLQNFAYRTELSAWIFIVAGLFTLLISFVTVYWQSRIAADANPVDSI